LTVEVDFWQRYRAGWHLLAGVTVLLVALFVAFADDAATHPAVVLGVLAAILLWYAIFGVPALRHENERFGLVYFFGVIVLLNGAYPFTMTVAYLLFMLNPQLFAMLDAWRWRVVLLVLLYGQIIVWTLIDSGFTLFSFAMIGLTAAVPMIFALLIGGYISGIIAQSRQRRELIAELTRTREALAAERHDAGVRAERERLAAEIHDTLAQGFTSIFMLTQAARAALRRSPAAVDGQLELIERAARENLAEARALVGALKPPDLAESGLAEALGRLAERHTRDTGVPVAVVIAGAGPDGTAGVDAVLLRATQEALTNVKRHAAASSVRIELSRADGQAAVAIVDDGRGFDPASAVEGYGLPGLRDRATAYGGTCTVRSAPGAGTTVRVSLPERPR
jgi:signal transduction histidine kinase